MENMSNEVPKNKLEEVTIAGTALSGDVVQNV